MLVAIEVAVSSGSGGLFIISKSSSFSLLNRKLGKEEWEEGEEELEEEEKAELEEDLPGKMGMDWGGGEYKKNREKKKREREKKKKFMQR